MSENDVAGSLRLLTGLDDLEIVRSYLREYAELPAFSKWSGHVFKHGPFLYALVRHVKPTCVAETGVYHGESTISILYALDRNGIPATLWSADPDPGVRKFMSNCVVGVPRWELYGGRGVEMLWALRELQKLSGKLDIFFHDSDHSYENQKGEYDLALSLLRPGGFIGGDDTRWKERPPFAFFDMCDERGLTPVPFGAGHLARMMP